MYHLHNTRFSLDAVDAGRSLTRPSAKHMPTQRPFAPRKTSVIVILCNSHSWCWHCYVLESYCFGMNRLLTDCLKLRMTGKLTQVPKQREKERNRILIDKQLLNFVQKGSLSPKLVPSKGSLYILLKNWVFDRFYGVNRWSGTRFTSLFSMTND